MNSNTLLLLVGFYYLTQDMTWKQLVGVSGALFGAFVYMIYQNQEKMLYMSDAVQPRKTAQNPPPLASPAQCGIANFKTVWLTTADGVKLHCWWIPYTEEDEQSGDDDNHDGTPDFSAVLGAAQMQSDPTAIREIRKTGKFQDSFMDSSSQQHSKMQKTETVSGSATTQRPTILFYHANAGNMGFRLPNLVAMRKAAKSHVFILDYRGYGESEGEPSELGLKIDAMTALDYLQSQIIDDDVASLSKMSLSERYDSEIHDLIDVSRIFVFGRSLGGAVSVYVSAMRSDRIAGLILENTFISISAMVKKVAAFLDFELVKKYMLRLDWNSLSLIGQIECPVLFFASTQDEVVPHEQMNELFENAKGTDHKLWVPIHGGTHNDGWVKGGPPYWDIFARFIEDPTNRASFRSSIGDISDIKRSLVNNVGDEQDEEPKESIPLPLRSDL